jgi:DNA-binding Lrp family transcriptional regulator
VQDRGVMELDETDTEILRILLSGARLSSRQIARKTGVSVGTVLSRMKKMEQGGNKGVL